MAGTLILVAFGVLNALLLLDKMEVRLGTVYSLGFLLCVSLTAYFAGYLWWEHVSLTGEDGLAVRVAANLDPARRSDVTSLKRERVSSVAFYVHLAVVMTGALFVILDEPILVALWTGFSAVSGLQAGVSYRQFVLWSGSRPRYRPLILEADEGNSGGSDDRD